MFQSRRIFRLIYFAPGFTLRSRKITLDILDITAIFFFSVEYSSTRRRFTNIKVILEILIVSSVLLIFLLMGKIFSLFLSRFY